MSLPSMRGCGRQTTQNAPRGDGALCIAWVRHSCGARSDGVRVDAELAALACVLSIKLVRQCLIVEGKQAKRIRRLPPELVFWLVVGMGLYRDICIQSV